MQILYTEEAVKFLGSNTLLNISDVVKELSTLCSKLDVVSLVIVDRYTTYDNFKETDTLVANVTCKNHYRYTCTFGEDSVYKWTY